MAMLLEAQAVLGDEEWMEARDLFGDWLAQVVDEFAPPGQKELAEQLRGSLADPAAADELYRRLRAQLSIPDLLAAADASVRLGVLDTLEPGQQARQLELVNEALDSPGLPELWKDALEKWRACLRDGSPGQAQVAEHWRALASAERSVRAIPLAGGPTEWPALNTVLHSCLEAESQAYFEALEWFLEFLNPLLRVPAEGSARLREAGQVVRERAKATQALVVRALETETPDPRFPFELQSSGMALKEAFDAFNDELENDGKTPCLACGRPNAPDRSLCSHCGARLPRDLSQASFSAGIGEGGAGAQQPLPENFQRLLEAIEGARSGDWDGLETRFQSFQTEYERWRRQMEQAGAMEGVIEEMELLLDLLDQALEGQVLGLLDGAQSALITAAEKLQAELSRNG